MTKRPSDSRKNKSSSLSNFTIDSLHKDKLKKYTKKHVQIVLGIEVPDKYMISSAECEKANGGKISKLIDTYGRYGTEEIKSITNKVSKYSPCVS